MNFIEFLERDEAKERLLEKRKNSPRRTGINKPQNQNLPPLKATTFKGARLIDPVAGERLLKSITSIPCGAVGGNITISSHLFTHFDWKTNWQRTKRFRRAKFAIQTMRFPQEVWQDKKNGRLVFVALFQFENNGKQHTLSSVVISDEDFEVFTYFSYINNQQALNEYRKGILLFPR